MKINQPGGRNCKKIKKQNFKTQINNLPQFAIIPNMFGNIIGNKSKIYERDWSKLDRENFILDYFSIEWDELLKIDELTADNLTKMYLDKINVLLDT